jgi:hypothetical protein
LGALSLGIKRPKREVGRSPPSSAEVKKCVELYFHSPTHLHGVVLRDNFTSITELLSYASADEKFDFMHSGMHCH